MIKLYKQIGETPLAALKRLRRQRPELENERLSYAGRLDPMASGILPILVGEENDRREDFLSRDKTYVFTVLFGVSTDTFDLLGLPASSVDTCRCSEDGTEKEAVNFECIVNGTKVFITQQKITNICDQLAGNQVMEYPPYSSKTVTVNKQQVPLWKVARAGRLDEITLPTKEVDIYDLQLQGITAITKNYIIYYIINQVEKVDGDFRQQEIIRRWKHLLTDNDADTIFPLASFRVTCSAGTYMRRLADTVGKRVGVPATAFSITRIGV